MHSCFRSLCTLLLLLAFISPRITEVLHASEHADSFHCSEKSAQHLHTPEHHCAFCDFVTAPSQLPNHQSYSLIPASTEVFLSFKEVGMNRASTQRVLSLRAPPVI